MQRTGQRSDVQDGMILNLNHAAGADYLRLARCQKRSVDYEPGTGKWSLDQTDLPRIEIKSKPSGWYQARINLHPGYRRFGSDNETLTENFNQRGTATNVACRDVWRERFGRFSQYTRFHIGNSPTQLLFGKERGRSNSLRTILMFQKAILKFRQRASNRLSLGLKGCRNLLLNLVRITTHLLHAGKRGSWNKRSRPNQPHAAASEEDTTQAQHAQPPNQPVTCWPRIQ